VILWQRFTGKQNIAAHCRTQIWQGKCPARGATAGPRLLFTTRLRIKAIWGIKAPRRARQASCHPRSMLFPAGKPNDPWADFIGHPWLYDGYSSPHPHERMFPTRTSNWFSISATMSSGAMEGADLAKCCGSSGSLVWGTYNRYFVTDRAAEFSRYGRVFPTGRPICRQDPRSKRHGLSLPAPGEVILPGCAPGRL